MVVKKLILPRFVQINRFGINYAGLKNIKSIVRELLKKSYALRIDDMPSQIEENLDDALANFDESYEWLCNAEEFTIELEYWNIHENNR